MSTEIVGHLEFDELCCLAVAVLRLELTRATISK